MKRFQALIAAVMACTLTAAPSLYGAEPAPAARAAPSEERVNLNFRATPIEQVFDMLSRKERVNIILSKGVTGTVTVNLYNVTVKEAIFSVAQAAGYWVEVRDGDYIILGKETSLDYPGANTQIKTFKVQYSDTKQVADILSKYVSRYGKVTPLVGRNLIVVEDLPGFAERVAKLLEEIDLQPKQVMIEAKILEISLDEKTITYHAIQWKGPNRPKKLVHKDSNTINWHESEKQSAELKPKSFYDSYGRRIGTGVGITADLDADWSIHLVNDRTAKVECSANREDIYARITDTAVTGTLTKIR